MRKKSIAQRSIFDVFAEHELGRELKLMSDWLDEHPEVLEGVAADLGRDRVKPTGRRGLSVETVLRCALLKQRRQLSYEELAFCLEDSRSFQAFARLEPACRPRKSVLQACIGRIRAESWERINRTLLVSAQAEKVERGRKVRVDSTVTETDIHPPTDSSLLWDGVRVLVRLLKWAQALAGDTRLTWHDHGRAAKKYDRQIQYGRGRQSQDKRYRKLLKVARATLDYLHEAQLRLEALAVEAQDLADWQGEAVRYGVLLARVIDQTERRVLKGETVPASEKVFSLFEAQPDIINKGGREIQYGHKLNLTTGVSGLVLDVLIEPGNPADSERFMPLLERQIACYGRAPRQVAADGGYASQANVRHAKALGVKDVAFRKKKGLRVEQMAKSLWVYRRLCDFRAGIEAGISCLKRAYGLTRCTWKGLSHFRAYVWSAVVAHNLAVFTRQRPT